ncbi:MAG TPA: hypothetical protein VI111_11145 [Thermoleophilaceae bacterium]
MIKAISEALIGVGLTIWLVASAVRHVERFDRRLLPLDKLGLLPHWNFFAPNPNRHDYEFAVRTAGAGRATPWRTLLVAPPRRPVVCAVWNPHRRRRKAFLDLSQALLEARAETPQGVMLSLPYLLLLNWATVASAAPLYARVQFTIARREGSRELQVVFLSEWHALDA